MATAKKIPSDNYKLVLELSAQESRYLRILAGSVVGREINTNLFDVLKKATGPHPGSNNTCFLYSDLSKELRDWVREG